MKNNFTPYYAVIFTSILKEEINGYSEMGDRMMELAKKQKGFLGVESAREDVGITVSYWNSLADIDKWKQNSEHALAQKMGKEVWYKSFKIRIAKVEIEYEFKK